MTVNRHHSQHEAADAVPLVTDSAVVTHREALDHNRNDEVEAVAATCLRGHDYPDLVATDHDGDPQVDWDGVAALLSDRRDSDDGALETLRTLHERFRRPYPSLLRLTYEVDTAFDFVAGQYGTIEFQRTPRPYSFANSPTEEQVEVCIRRVPDGRLTSELFEDLDVGDEITVRGPYGDFVLREPSDRDMVFLATGTGVAPLKSMIEYALETGHDEFGGERRHVWLFLGCGWTDDLPYRDHFEALDDERPSFHFVPTLSRESILTEWAGETDYVQRTLVKYLADEVKADITLDGAMGAALDEDPVHAVDARLDPDRMEVYACGISAMVDVLVEAAERIGVDATCIEAEGFG